ncbi:hypothetical protein KTC92_07100 [Clostridium sp. CM027]|uniref:hypothetical protein n=1 Tax=Clostridium sp. CM027 TaxID=2849865 RepID=UPI001C6E552D|nr:hypothetical protein [Clostridium sp. CM027]MBW9147133.1 hypothetical protein [Clostridium sp. CM027]UVE42204.1 hypothetical protein KTC92_07100 [Clostridium sp. CM027]
MNKNILLKKIIPILTSVMISTTLIPTVNVFAAETSTEIMVKDTNYTELTNCELDQIINSTASEILQEAPIQNPTETNSRPKRGVATVASKLIKKLGKHYVKVVLPKKIYHAFPRALAAKVSEGAFVGAFNTYVLMGPLDEVHSIVTDYLSKYVPHVLASTCGYIAQGIVYAVI